MSVLPGISTRFSHPRQHSARFWVLVCVVTESVERQAQQALVLDVINDVDAIKVDAHTHGLERETDAGELKSAAENTLLSNTIMSGLCFA